MFVIATAGGADASFTKGACVATRAAVLFAGRCVKTGTVTECEGLTVEFAGTGDAAFSFGTGCEAVSAMGIIVGEIETLSVAHRFVGQTVMRVFGATASDTGLIVETRGSARGVIVDATASDTGLVVDTCGLACIDVASADRFAAIGRIIVAVVVSQLTNACAVLAEHEIAADVATGTAIFAVAREIGADARGTKREICGTTDRAMAFFAGFIAFARGCTVTAVFGVALEIDTASVAPVLVGRTSV